MRMRARQGCGIFDECNDEVTCAHVMSQVTELFAGVWIVTKILNDRAAIGVPVRFLQLLGRGAWKSGKQRGLEIYVPKRIDQRLM